MGAINYGTSDYITLAIQPYDRDCPDTIAYAHQMAEDMGDDTPEMVEKLIDQDESDFYSLQRENIQSILDNYEFYYYDITIKPGYYEGFSLNIENKYITAYNDCLDKRDAQKELTRVKKCLIECADNGLVKCTPGWCTGYYDHNDTIKSIGETIKKMRAEAKETPTWALYNRNIYTRRTC